MNFKENLKKLRLKKGLTQPQLAKLLNKPLPTVRNWEQGKNQASYESLELLTKILECDYNELLK